jgi:hypothetical protein
MADLDFLDSLGILENELRQPESAYQKLILQIANQVTEDFKKYIGEKVHNTGGLMQSVVYMPTGSFSFEIQADEYYAYQDQGVNAAPLVEGYDYKRPRVQGSIFSFKYSSPGKNMVKAIKEWKGLDSSQAYFTARSIKMHGLKPRNITENVMTDAVLNQIASDLATVTGLIFDVSFTKNTDKWQ